MHNFAVIGVGGFVAPRHLDAIRDTGNCLLAAVDPSDSVGILDRYAFDVKFFREIERFDRFLEKARRGPEAGRVQYLTVCSPNYLHDAHVRLGLRVGANVICEKPLVINPWNLDALQELEAESGRRISTVLQLRHHPNLLRLRGELSRTRRHEVQLTYITARGGWYDVSWKGSEERSGGLVTNIGIHLFDLLIWLFGRPLRSEVHLREHRRVAGFIELERARVRWLLSAERDDLPFAAQSGQRTSFRSMVVDGQEVEFTDGVAALHTRAYEEILAGRGFGIAEARPSIELVHQIRSTPVSTEIHAPHPMLARF